jgi:serine/threonine-protein kinase
MTETSPEPYRPAIVRGRYRVTGVLRRAVHGDSVEALDPREDRDVVLKRVAEPSRSESTRLRLANSVLSGLGHANVAHVRELIEARNEAWLVSDRARGRAFDRFWDALPLATSSPYDERWRHGSPIANALFDALDAMHRRQFAHLDVKPANVLIDPAGHVVLVDVGTGRAPQPEDAPDFDPERWAYVAPELLDGISTSRLADQWALGAILYRMIAGRRAIAGQNAAEVRKSYGVGKVQPLREWRSDTPPLVDEIVCRMLAWDPEGRFPSLHVVRATFGDLLSPSLPPRPRMWSIPAPTQVGIDTLDAFLRKRLRELASGQGGVVRIADEPDSGKTTLLASWAATAREAGFAAFEASCLPGAPRAVLHGWFKPPPVDPAQPPPADLVDQAIAALPSRSVLLLDALEDCDAIAWARIARAGGLALGRAPLLLVLAGRALPELGKWAPEGSPRLFNVTLPRLHARDVEQLLRPAEDTEEERQLLQVVAETHSAAANGLAGRVVRTFLDEERAKRQSRDGRRWLPQVGQSIEESIAPVPASGPVVLGCLAELGGACEVDLLLTALPVDRGAICAALDWAEDEGKLTIRRFGKHWFAQATDRGSNPEIPGLQALHGRAARWIERNASLDGLLEERVADHWRRAGEPGRAGQSYAKASRAQAAIGSSSEARRLQQLASTFVERGGTGPFTNPSVHLPR